MMLLAEFKKRNHSASEGMYKDINKNIYDLSEITHIIYS